MKVTYIGHPKDNGEPKTGSVFGIEFTRGEPFDVPDDHPALPIFQANMTFECVERKRRGRPPKVENGDAG